MAGQNHRITINIRSRNPEDQKRQLKLVKDTFGRSKGRELNINLPEGDAQVASQARAQPAPNEPLETDIAKRVNARLDAKHAELRRQGVDPDAKRLASAEERVRARSRLAGFGKWCADKTGGASVTLVVKGLWEGAKGMIGL